MSDMIKKAFEYIDSNRDEMLKLWEELVNLEGKVDEPELVTLVSNRIAKEMDSMGVSNKVIAVGNDKAGTLVGILGGERKGKAVIFGGHMDTVFKKGEFGGENPFKIEDGKAYGPGALDMKGGITIALFVAKALTYAGYDERPIKFIFSGDEENGHKGSIGGKVMIEEGAGGICAFNMETGPINNNLCTSRSTSIRVTANVKGVSAHAGNNFTAGRNAVVEAAHKLLAMEKLTNLDEGTTCNPAIISGGTIVNSVPDTCTVQFDIRVKTHAEQDRVLAAIKEILEKPVVEGTSVEYEVDQSNLVIYFNTDEVKRFFEFVNKSAKKHGFKEFGQTYLGGSSDAGNIVVGGTPAICSFGVRGEWNHTPREYAVVESLFERAKIIAAVVCEMEGVAEL
ncbi:MAG: M20/M25/M40 family metallo-hydrolase [Defluviitaleaceae bacterium]|nr:M20/M25/M40 family metallo-hydrolase [Defluviitaleaceae bacterium]